jgi:ABC-type bacteriocin/lantibiotic exporter with double-glycine peptidase domain
VNSLGLSYQGKVANSGIEKALNANEVVILNVHNGAHWVLAHSMSGSTIHVNDPGFSTTSYTLSEIVAGASGLYRVSGSPTVLSTMIWEIEYLFNVNGKREKMMQADGGLIESQ